MNVFNTDFWDAIDKLIADSKIVIDRSKGSPHPKYPDFIYHPDYRYLENTSSTDGCDIDVWLGNGERKEDAVMCIIGLTKKDSNIKILVGCTEKEKEIVYNTHNTWFIKGIMLQR